MEIQRNGTRGVPVTDHIARESEGCKGEPLLVQAIQHDLGWNVEVPGYRDSVELSTSTG